MEKRTEETSGLESLADPRDKTRKIDKVGNTDPATHLVYIGRAALKSMELCRFTPAENLGCGLLLHNTRP